MLLLTARCGVVELMPVFNGSDAKSWKMAEEDLEGQREPEDLPCYTHSCGLYLQYPGAVGRGKDGLTKLAMCTLQY